MESLPTTNLQLRSLVDDKGNLELRLIPTEVTAPTGREVLLRVEATPINPSDLGLLLAGAELASFSSSNADGDVVTTATIDPAMLRSLGGRLGESMTIGNEGAGTVIATGDAPEAQALLGKTVSVAGGSMYAQYRIVDAGSCLVLPEGTPASEGASSFVNPLTALGMIETMRLEGHSAIVHTAAASNLGQMLVKLCLEEEVPLVAIVRSQTQAATLRAIGATHVCDSSSPTFMADLIAAVTETKATIAFDAIGGGDLGGKILTAMEVAANANAASYSRYGSTTHKQLYIYGGLDRSPTVLNRSFGFAWGVGGWLLTPFLMRIGGDGIRRLQARVASGLSTTFKSSYSRTISLEEALDPEVIRSYAKQATGEKVLIVPNVS